MSGQSKETVFDRYSKRKQQPDTKDESSLSAVPVEDAGRSDTKPPNPPSQDASGDEDEVVQGGIYKAAFVFKSKQRQRLRLHYGDGVKIKVLSYAYLIEIVSTSHQWLTLVFSSTIVTLRGRNLHMLIELIQDERVRALVCFRPGIHPEPASNEPCISDVQERGLHEFANEKEG